MNAEQLSKMSNEQLQAYLDQLNGNIAELEAKGLTPMHSQLIARQETLKAIMRAVIKVGA